MLQTIDNKIKGCQNIFIIHGQWITKTILITMKFNALKTI